MATGWGFDQSGQMANKAPGAEVVQALAEGLGADDGDEEHDLVGGPPAVVAAREHAVDAQVDDGREAPHFLRRRGVVPQQAAQRADAHQQGHGEQLMPEHGRDRDQASRDQAGDVAPHQARHQAAFQAQIHGFVRRRHKTDTTLEAKMAAKQSASTKRWLMVRSSLSSMVLKRPTRTRMLARDATTHSRNSRTMRYSWRIVRRLPAPIGRRIR